MSNVTSLKIIVFAGAIALSLASPGQAPAWAAGGSSIDTDGDGSISLQEAHDKASKRFEALDTQHTGKLTEQQASPMSRAIGEMARHDKRHSIDKDAYMAGVDAAFREADPKGTETLNAAALKTKAGKHFLSLVE